MESVKLAVNGTLMRGLPLEGNLLEAGAVFLREAATAPCELPSVEHLRPKPGNASGRARRPEGRKRRRGGVADARRGAYLRASERTGGTFGQQGHAF